MHVTGFDPVHVPAWHVELVPQAFPHVALVASADALAGRVGANFVIVASAAPLPLTALRARLDRVDEPVTVLEGAALNDFVDGAAVLTDDYAPVDQLLAGQNTGPRTDLLLRLRREVTGRYGRCDLPMWRDAIVHWGESNGSGPDALSAEPIRC